MKKVRILVCLLSMLGMAAVLTTNPATGHGGGHSGGHGGSHAYHASHGNISRSRMGGHGHGTRRSSHSRAHHHGRGWHNRHGYGWRNNRFNLGYWNNGWGLWWGGAWMPWSTWCTTYGYGWGWNDCLDYPNGGAIPGDIIQRVQQEMPDDEYDEGY